MSGEVYGDKVLIFMLGIGIPRIVDPGGNITNTEDPSIKGKEKAEQKGLSYNDQEPIFQSVNAIDSVPISWTLGSVLLTASGSQSPFINYPSETYTNGRIFNFTGVNGKLLALEESTGVRVAYVLAVVAVLALLYYLYRYTRRRKETAHRYSTIPTQMEEGTEAISLNDITRTPGKTPLGSVGRLQRLLRRLSKTLPWNTAPRSRTPKLRHSGGVTTSPSSQPLQHTSSSPAVMTIKSAPSTPKRGSPRLGGGTVNHSSKSSEDVNANVTGLGLFRNTLNPLSRSNSSVGIHEQQQQQQQQPSQLNPQSVYTHNNTTHTPPRASLSSRNNSSVNLTTLVSRSTSSAKLNNIGFVQDDDDR